MSKYWPIAAAAFGNNRFQRCKNNMTRIAEIERKTKETQIFCRLELDGESQVDVATQIPFFDHMLTLFAVHGRLGLTCRARGDLEVDFHHTVEDVGLVLGEVLAGALGDKKGICRYGQALTPMDEALSQVVIDLSGRPYLVFNLPSVAGPQKPMEAPLVKEFLRAFSVKGGFNLHVEVKYGENWHHILESVFKGMGRALKEAVAIDRSIKGVLSSKGSL